MRCERYDDRGHGLASFEWAFRNGLVTRFPSYEALKPRMRGCRMPAFVEEIEHANGHLPEQ